MTLEPDDKPGTPDYHGEPYEHDIEDEARDLPNLISGTKEIILIIKGLLKNKEDIQPATIKIFEHLRAIAEDLLRHLVKRETKVQEDLAKFGVDRPTRAGIPLEDVRPDEPPTPLPPSERPPPTPPPQKPPKDGGKPNGGRKK